MDYPLRLSFKVLAIGHQLSVEDARGNLLWYVKQKVLALREAITVFADRERTLPLFRIQANRVIDFNAVYRMSVEETGEDLGAVRRRGARSLWRAHYEVHAGAGVAFVVREENPWTKLGDALLGEVPVLGLFSGYFFHPRYLLARPDGSELFRLEKRPALWEGRFDISRLGEMSPEEERLGLLSLMVTVLMEKRRG